MKRHSSDGDLKVIRLFDAMDKMEDYDEAILLKKNPSIAKQQLSNLKAHLYKIILASLRLIKQEDNITIQLHEQMDFARILYNKGLYLQTLKVLERMKEQARQYEQITYLQQILFFEKKIEALYITRSMQDRAGQLSVESEIVDDRLTYITKLSNLSLQLYSWFIQNGVARNEKEGDDVKKYLEDHLPKDADKLKGFYQQLYFYQCHAWVAFIRRIF